MDERSPCVKCGRILHTGEGRVLVSFTADELCVMIDEVADPRVRARLACALSLLDPQLAGTVDR
jgi:hypothetical protein